MQTHVIQQHMCCSGVVHDFDRLRHRHTISYQDGDIEIIPLWAPNQMVSHPCPDCAHKLIAIWCDMPLPQAARSCILPSVCTAGMLMLIT